METIKAKIASFSTLDPSTKNEIEKSLKLLYGKNIEFIYEIDKSQIAGFVIKIGSKTIDLSVKNLIIKA